MIRATRLGLFDLLHGTTGRQMAALRKAQEQAITGLKVNRPSDAPVSISEIHRVDASSRDQEVYANNASLTESVLSIVDGALASVSDLVIRAREIAVAMAGDTVGDDARAAAAVEVRGLYDALVDVANTDVAGRYVFSGTGWSTAAFDSDGTYGGTTDEPTVQVGDDRWVASGFDGSQVFQGTVDVFGVLDDLASALEANDATTVSSALGDLDDATVQVSTWRARAGTEMNLASDAAEIADGLGVLLNDRLSDLVQVDPAEAYMRLTEMQSAYQATLQVASTSTARTLFDML